LHETLPAAARIGRKILGAVPVWLVAAAPGLFSLREHVCDWIGIQGSETRSGAGAAA